MDGCELIVLTGPTAVGKTELSLSLAERLGCEIISADSRQVYREMLIGTAAPTAEQLSRVPHHFVRCRSVREPMNAYDYEHEALAIMPEVFRRGGGRAIMTGGSMMYIDAVCEGIDEMPTIADDLRLRIKQELESKGLAYMQAWLSRLDPEYYAVVDRQNPRRVVHAIELCLQSGKTYTELRRRAVTSRPFTIRRIALVRDRTELCDRIGRRVDQMMADGLLDEVRSLSEWRDLTPLNTVGYRELFGYLDGRGSLEEAVEKIKTNTRRYAKKQMTWLKSKDYSFVSADADLEVLLGMCRGKG